MNNRTPVHKRRSEDKYLAELEKVYRALFDQPQTMKELDQKIGVMRESICWYCRALRLSNRLYKVRQRVCKVTKYPTVWELTTDPNKAINPITSQLKLF